ncbi:hypothetical protein ACFU3J_21040 [Streptomyces sp. NPDC057411]|uniref:hypothetical protein n=1 Tax=unclassified Streptomyces TaxID=2593676 RepID=UPI00362DAAFE
MNLRSSWVAETGQTREDTRLTQTGVTTPLNTVQVRSGILPGSYDGQYRLSGLWMNGTAAMTATVHEGRAVIQGSISQGAYPVALTTEETVTFTAGDAQYGRKDLVVVKIYDNVYDSSNRNEAKIEIVKGVPAQTPVAPAAPPLSLPLWEVTVPAGASAGNGGIPWNSALKDLRTPVVSAGGILPLEGPTQRGTYPGQYQDTPDGQFQRWDGGKWVAYPAGVGGIIPASASTLPASYTGQYRAVADGPLQRWNGSAWAPAYPGPYFNDSLDAGYTVSTTYVNTLVERAENPLTVSFVAPESKQAILSFGSRMELTLGSGGTSVASSAFMCVRITQGTTVIREVEDELAAMASRSADPTDASSVSTVQRLYNLTPGQTYTLTAYYRTSNATMRAWFDNTYIQVTPQY